MGKVIGCGFCPETANLTGEHLWSQWFGNKLGKRDYLITRKEVDGSVRQWHKKTLNEMANVVCGTCNNTWMSVLESKTKLVTNKMVFDCSPSVLQAGDIAALAANAFKSAVVADLMHDNRPPFFTLFERRRFAKGLTIPAGVQMWLGSMATRRGLFKSHYFTTPTGTSCGFELNVFTYGMGHLVIQVVTSRWRKKAHRRHALPPVVTQAIAWDRVSVPFWPSDGTPVSWPPSAHLGDEIIDEFSVRWRNSRKR